MDANTRPPSTPVVGITHLQLSPSPVAIWAVSVPAMPNGDEEFIHTFKYRSRGIEVTFLPDDEGTTPSDENEIKLTQEQAQAWELGQWWYHNILVQILDGHGEWLELPSQATSYGYGRVPSFMDHNHLVQAICDGLCNELDAAGVPPF